jgi:hypothetical protein
MSLANLTLLFSILVPSIFLGMVLGLFSWFLLRLTEKLFHHKSLKSSFFLTGSIGLISFLIVVMLYAYSIIYFTYQLSIPSSPIATEKQLVQDEVVTEAFQKSIVPPIFQQPCSRKPKLVCELAEGVSLKLWDRNITFDDVPLLAGFVSASINICFLIFGDFTLPKRKSTLENVSQD